MELTGAEQRLIDAAKRGEEADYSAATSAENDPVIHAETIYALATRSNRGWPVHAKGIRVRAARIKGLLDFTAAEIKCALALIGCYIDEAITLDDASARTIILSGTHVFGIQAHQ